MQKKCIKICVCQIFVVILHAFSAGDRFRCHRITVSTQDFHSCNRGSIPLGTTKTFPKVKS